MGNLIKAEILHQDTTTITYKECQELWENENTLVHKDRSEKIVQEVSAHICRVCELCKQDILLNIGCGDGLFDGVISSKVSKMYGVDFSKQKLDVARNKWGDKIEYYQHDFLCDYPEVIKNSGINKIYSYEVMQYCNPDDVDLFLLNQLKLCIDDRDYIIAHLDVPDKSKAIKYYKRVDPSITESMVGEDIISLFNDGSYWHDMDSIKKIAQKYDIDIEVNDAHYWDYRTDIVFRFHGNKV